MILLRAIGYLWSAPTVLVTLLVFLLPLWALRQLGPAGWSLGAWEWEVRAGSFWDRTWAPDWAGATLGWAILYAPGVRAAATVHEHRHVQQSLVLGPLYVPVWLFCTALYGYRNNPLEVDARAAAGEP